MSIASYREYEKWVSSRAGEANPITGAFVFHVSPTLMVPQTLQYLAELSRTPPATQSSTMRDLLSGMRYWHPEKMNALIMAGNFADENDLLAVRISELEDKLRQVELIADINLTFSSVTFFADRGTGLDIPLLTFNRLPISRGIGFELEERGQTTNSICSIENEQMKENLKTPILYYSTGLGLLAAEDQVAGLLDAAYMQFYLAIEFLLGTHSQKDVEKIGKEKFNHEFDAVTCQAVKQVYLVRHMYFGHAHPNRASNGDPDHTFSIVKQILVARWALAV